MHGYENEYIKAAKILNEAVRKAELEASIINESNICIPNNPHGLQELEELPITNIDTSMSIGSQTGLIIAVRAKREGGRAGAASQHACSIKFGARKIPITVPRQSYLDIPKLEPRIKRLKVRNKKEEDEARIAIRFVYDCQAILIAIWDCENTKDKEILFAMLRDKIVENDYYNNNTIKGPKSNEELEKDRAEIKARLNASGKHKE